MACDNVYMENLHTSIPHIYLKQNISLLFLLLRPPYTVEYSARISVQKYKYIIRWIILACMCSKIMVKKIVKGITTDILLLFSLFDVKWINLKRFKLIHSRRIRKQKEKFFFYWEERKSYYFENQVTSNKHIEYGRSTLLYF